MELLIAPAFLSCMNYDAYDSEVHPLRLANMILLYIVCGTLMAVTLLILMFEISYITINRLSVMKEILNQHICSAFDVLMSHHFDSHQTYCVLVIH